MHLNCLYDFEIDIGGITGTCTFFGELICWSDPDCGFSCWVLRRVRPKTGLTTIRKLIAHKKFESKYGDSEVVVIPRVEAKNFRWSTNA